MSRVVKTGQIKSVAPSSAYVAYYPCLQSSSDTTLIDRSGNNNHGSKSSVATWDTNASTGVWKNANAASSFESAGGAACLELANSTLRSFDYAAGDTLIFSVRVKGTAPAASYRALGNTNHSTANPGFALRFYTGGQVDLLLASSVSTLTLPAAGGSAGVVLNGVEHTLTVVVDGTNKKFWLYVDGVIDSYCNGLAIGDGVTPYDFKAPAYNCKIGGGWSSGGITAQWRDIHVLVKEGSGVTNHQAIADWFHSSRQKMLPSVLLS